MIRALFSYGSTLSPATRGPDSLPDQFALVDDLPSALTELGHSHLARIVHRLIPPITIAHRGGKLSLITPEQARDELSARRDLYLAGRLSKKIIVHHGDVDALVETAIRIIIEWSALGLGRRISVQDALLRCLAISYHADIRPEGPDKPARLYRAFPDFYRARYLPRILAHARSRGLIAEDGHLYDARSDEIRRAEKQELSRFLYRARLRSMARWPQQLFVYRGSIGYVAAKLRRVTIGA